MISTPGFLRSFCKGAVLSALWGDVRFSFGAHMPYISLLFSLLCRLKKMVDATHNMPHYRASAAIGVGVAKRDVRAEAAGARVRTQLRGLRGNGLGLRNGRGRQQGIVHSTALILV